ncbi:50S ribosomal protein L2 [Candidatus Uhrbacteria bacterium RIFCSPHIGHO2_12_FULL_60_25]|uniref:Large ribosomal subunit protein uL2 n=1 Tax=Candidatus Uhrbacteria bacterium RIFCSPHIGHO2_12_FULL_60_25 TaxID=1802399 RepID=A0A1F7ULS6_9BACT|nr:MAG: 50S ribosomal protein L2 [Candidatus Uhrbacteria bacterium RIFCSPHIGHO2_02_FULL_60_44]OGL79221.1 MAG: 50S ribosomal protein L2 [Candidatus Uhrbacteria bacterium RIFCSPHIGHO2_12_FULL_60_25]
MPIKIYRPVTKGRRISSVQDFSDITRFKPEKSLTLSKKEMAGRSGGKITVRHRGAGHKTLVRVIDFIRDKFDIPAKVTTIEYDPNRGARISLLVYKDGEKRYMITPDGMKVGDTVVSSKTQADITTGNRLPLEKLPVGVIVHSVELQPGKGGQLARGAGNSVQIMAVEGSYATLKLPSGEIRNVPKICMATIGTVSNPDWRLVRWGKAGRMRHRGIRPTVRGKAMNPVDHPHGGGEGKHPIGLPYAKTKWGKHAMGVKTRKKHKGSNALIVTRRGGKPLTK